MQIVCQAGQTTGLGLEAMLNFYLKIARTSVPNYRACFKEGHRSGLDGEMALPSVSQADVLK